MATNAQAGPSAVKASSPRPLPLLSSINLSNLPENVTGIPASSLTSDNPKQDYLLPPYSLNPTKDLLLLISRDPQPVSTPTSSNVHGGSSSNVSSSQIAAQAAAAAAKSAAAPAPTGMSDRFAAARAAMMAQQRAKLLAKQAAATAAGGGGGGGTSSTYDATTAPIPAEMAKPPAMRASLWRAADGADKAQRVWQVDIGMALEDLIDAETLKKSGHLGDAKEVCGVGAVEWVSDGRLVAIAVHIQRSSMRAPTISRQVLLFLDVQTGRKERVLQIDAAAVAGPGRSADGAGGRIVGMRWTCIGPSVAKAPRSSSESLLADLPPLPNLATLEQPIPPHLAALPPHMLQRLLKERARLAGEDVPRAPLETPISDPKGLGRAVAQFPRGSARHRSIGLAGGQEGGRKGKATLGSALARQGRSDEEKDGQLQQMIDGVLAAWDDRGNVHVLLSAGVYLGCVAVQRTPREEGGEEETATSSIIAASITPDLHRLDVILGPWKLAGPVFLRRFNLPLRHPVPGVDLGSSSKSLCLLRPCQHLTHLSTMLFHLIDYLLVSLAHIRNAHAAARRVASKWTGLLAAAGSKFASDAANELLVCLITGRAGEAAESLLLGNDSLTIGATGKMRDEMRDGLGNVVVGSRTEFLPACERLLVVLDELQGCERWEQGFGSLLHCHRETESETDERGLGGFVRRVGEVAKAARLMQELAEAERIGVAEFHKWWEYESERQECLRRDGAEPRLKPTFDALSVAELLRRGFYSRSLDQMLMSPETLRKRDEEDARAAKVDTSMDGDGEGDESVGGVAKGTKGQGRGKGVDEVSRNTESAPNGVKGGSSSALDPALSGLEDLLSTQPCHILDVSSSTSTTTFSGQARRHDLAAMYSSNDIFVPALPRQRIPDRTSPLHEEIEEILKGLERLMSGALGRCMERSGLVRDDEEEERKVGRVGGSKTKVGRPVDLKRKDGMESCNMAIAGQGSKWEAGDGSLVARSSSSSSSSPETPSAIAFVSRWSTRDRGTRDVLSVLSPPHPRPHRPLREEGGEEGERVSRQGLVHALVDPGTTVLDLGYFAPPTSHDEQAREEVVLLVRRSSPSSSSSSSSSSSPTRTQLLRVPVGALSALEVGAGPNLGPTDVEAEAQAEVDSLGVESLSLLPSIYEVSEIFSLPEPYSDAEQLAVNDRTKACATMGRGARVAYWDLGAQDEEGGEEEGRQEERGEEMDAADEI